MEKRHCNSGSEMESSQDSSVSRSGNSNGNGDSNWYIDENLVHEIMQRMDAKTLARSSCVCRAWKNTAADEALWENICNSAAMASRGHNLQFKTVVKALGGFRRLYIQWLRPLLGSSSSASPAPPPSLSTTRSSLHSASLSVSVATANGSVRRDNSNSNCSGYRKRPRPSTHWGKDEVHLSMALFSVDCFSRIGKNNRMASATAAAAAAAMPSSASSASSFHAPPAALPSFSSPFDKFEASCRFPSPSPSPE